MTIDQQSEFPRNGLSVLTMRMREPATFAVWFGLPAWATPAELRSGGGIDPAVVGRRVGAIPARQWQNGDRITSCDSASTPRLIEGRFGNSGRWRPPGGRSCWPTTSAHNAGLFRRPRPS